MPFWKPWELEMAPKSNYSEKFGAGTLLKRSPGAVLKKHERSMNKLTEINGFGWSKTIEKYWKTNIFVDCRSFKKTDEKTIPKGISKVMFLGPKWRHGPPRFDLSYDFWCFAAMPKNHHFWTPSRTNKSNKSSLGAPRAEQKVQGASPGVSFLARRVRGAASRARTSEEKNDRGAEEQLVQDLTRHGPMAWRILRDKIKYIFNMCIYVYRYIPSLSNNARR